MSPAFCKWLLTKVLGWTMDPPQENTGKAIILGVPHTTIWDCAIGYLYYRAYGRRFRVMIKKEAFFWPASWLLRSLGGFPVDRKNSGALIKSLIEEMEASEDFHLVICPEGTRKAIKKWKTGYHVIARATGVPVFMGYFDWKEKRVGIVHEAVELTDNAREDTDRIQALYEQMHLTAKFPDMYITH